MIFSKIWERYFLYELLKVFLLFICCFYGLYVLIDYASHAAVFHHHSSQFRWSEVIIYYLWDFDKRVEVLIPFAILIATVKTLTRLNVYNELIAMMASGVKLKTLMRPFIFVGLFFTALLFLNEQYLLPHTLINLKSIENLHSTKKEKTNDVSSVQHVALEDQSKILFQNYDSSHKLFFDAYWVRSVDDIWRIKHLYPYEEIPMGHFVDHIIRNPTGELVLAESLPYKQFPEIRFNQESLLETVTSVEELSLSDLFNKLSESKDASHEKEAQVITTFYQRLALPWLCLIAVIGPAPFCLRFTRSLPTFFIYAGSTFGLVAIYLILDAALVLGKRQVFDPFWVIWAPFLIIITLLGWNYCRIK